MLSGIMYTIVVVELFGHELFPKCLAHGPTHTLPNNSASQNGGVNICIIVVNFVQSDLLLGV